MLDKSPVNKTMVSPARKSPQRPTCETCGYFDASVSRCRKTPSARDVLTTDWCGEHTEFPEYLKAFKAK